jgi:hypothetical protein
MDALFEDGSIVVFRVKLVHQQRSAFRQAGVVAKDVEAVSLFQFSICDQQNVSLFVGFIEATRIGRTVILFECRYGLQPDTSCARIGDCSCICQAYRSDIVPTV